MRFRILACLPLFLPALPLQDPEPAVGESQTETPQPAPSRVERSLETIAALEKSRASKQSRLKIVREQLAALGSQEDPGQLEQESRTLQTEIEKIKADYDSIVTGIDLKAFGEGPEESFDLQSELQELVQPIVEELKTATEAPRQIERLRARLTYIEDKARLAQRALDNVVGLLAELEPDDPQGLRPGLEVARELWEGRIQDLDGQRSVASFQLDKRLSERSSIIESTQAALANFFRTRGLNLLLGTATFFLVLFGLRALYRVVGKRLSRKDGRERPFYSRLLDVLYLVFISVAALVAALLVLYASGDWVLLGITLLFLFGLAWASKTAIPMFLEQIRLLLNLGAVRERERVLLDGIPYRVSKLSIYTLLSNSELAGGVRRLPIRDLIEMRSRTCSKDEVWFPSRRGDWVLLSDGTRGRVKHQSPDFVQLELLGGARTTYPSTEFLGLFPRNLSDGFRVQVIFGIDYSHQAISVSEVPGIFAARVTSGLHERFGEPSLVRLQVEFFQAGASSLDYAIIGDFAGEAAPFYDAVQREIQRLCVQTCNAQGWVIPFTQVTLHQAATGETAP